MTEIRHLALIQHFEVFIIIVMNIQELISSGKLELYVAGTLSDREMGEIALYADDFPEVAYEVSEIELAIVDLLGGSTLTLSDKDKEHELNMIWKRIHAQEAQSKGVVPMFRVGKLAAAAITAGFILMSGAAIWSGVRNSELNGQVASLMDNQQKMVASNQQTLATNTRMEQQFTLMRNILTKRVELTNVANNKFTSQGNYMLVYWNPETKKLMLADANLPSLTPDQQFQLWALYDGKTVDAGVFDATNNNISTSFQKDISNAQAFAVTVEPKGGSKSPTLSNLCMMAKL
jgi:hypothetical protein